MAAFTTRRRAPALDWGYLTDDGLLDWLLSLDHKRVAMMQLAGVLAAALVGGLAAMALRFEHLGPGVDALDGPLFARTFTLHGAIMVFLVLVPGIPATLGSFVLPLKLGARNLAFPRVNLAAFHLWLLGAALIGVSIHRGGADTGFGALPPLSTGAAAPVGWLLAAMAVLAVAAALRAVVLLATLHELRRGGLGWRDTGPLAWSLYANSAVTLVSAPVLALSVILLLAERSLGIGLFDPSLGGDPTLFQHFFWFGAHGLLAAALLPALGVVTEILGAFAAGPLPTRRSVAVGLAGLAVLGTVSWGVHLPTSGHGPSTTALFALFALLAAVPATHLVGAWVVALTGGARSRPVPLLLALGAALAFVLGGLSGLFLVTPSLAVHLHGTAFVVGHAHLVAGSGVLAFLAALTYWWPKLTGVAATEKLGRVGVLLSVSGLIVTNLPLLVAGARGLPRRVVTYPDELQLLEQLAFLGAATFAFGVVLVLIPLAVSLRRRTAAGPNPWSTSGLEWESNSPPPLLPELTAAGGVGPREP